VLNRLHRCVRQRLSEYSRLSSIYDAKWIAQAARLEQEIWHAHPVASIALDRTASAGLQWREDCLGLLDKAGVTVSKAQKGHLKSCDLANFHSAWSEIHVAGWLIKQNVQIQEFDKEGKSDIEICLPEPAAERGRISIKTPYDDEEEKGELKLLDALRTALTCPLSRLYCPKGVKYSVMPMGKLSGLCPEAIDAVVEEVAGFVRRQDLSHSQELTIMKSSANKLPVDLNLGFEPNPNACLPTRVPHSGSMRMGYGPKEAEERFRSFLKRKLSQENGWGKQLRGAEGIKILLVDATAKEDDYWLFISSNSECYDVLDVYPQAKQYIDCLEICIFGANIAPHLCRIRSSPQASRTYPGIINALHNCNVSFKGIAS